MALKIKAKAKCRSKSKAKAKKERKDPIKELCLTDEIYSRLIRCLQTSSELSRLIGREKEQEQIENFLFVEQVNKGRVLYIAGQPGTGKSATIQSIINHRIEYYPNDDILVIELNAVLLSKPENFYQWLYERIPTLHSAGRLPHWTRCEPRITKYFSGNRGKKSKVILIVDEVDYLLAARRYGTETRQSSMENLVDQKILMSILNWCDHPSSLLKVILISNTLALPQRLMKKAQSRFINLTIEFRPYDAEQLLKILYERLDPDLYCFFEGLESDTKNSSLDFLARKVSSIGGDLRLAFSMGRKAVTIAKAECKNQVTRSVVSQADKSMNKGFNEIFSAEGILTKVLIICYLRLLATENGDVSMYDLITEFRRVMRTKTSSNLCSSLFNYKEDYLINIISKLQSIGIFILECDTVKEEYYNKPGFQLREAFGNTTFIYVEGPILMRLIRAIQCDDELNSPEYEEFVARNEISALANVTI